MGYLKSIFETETIFSEDGKFVLIAGPSHSGKTTLLGRLSSQKPLETFTSMTENIGEFVADVSVSDSKQRRITLVDLPGLYNRKFCQTNYYFFLLSKVKISNFEIIKNLSDR
jgi:signal recognition particle receptor subunit beta